MKKICIILGLLFWAISASGVTLTLHFNDSHVDSIQIEDNFQMYFYDPDMEVTRLQAPVNGAANVPQLAEFSWQHVVDRDVELLISEIDDFSDTTYYIRNIDTNFYKLTSPLDVQKRYYWKVRIEGESLWTAAWYFDTYMPTLPDMLYSLALLPSNIAGNVKLKASYDSEVDSFLVVYGLNGLDFPDTCFVDTSLMEISGLDIDSCYYMRVAGVNAAGIGPLSEVLAISASTVEDPVLIINAFDRLRSWNSRDFIRQHAEAVLENGYALVSATNEAMTDDLLSLPFYSSIIYILGEESTADETFSGDEQDVIEDYLKKGGDLFVSGAEIAWDLDYSGSTADKAFCHDYLKLAYRQDAPNGAIGTYYNVQAVGDTIFSDLNSFAFDNGTHGTYNVRYPDVYTPLNDARMFLKYTGCNTGAAGIVFEGMFPGGSSEGKLMVLGFPFETVYPEEARNAIMREFFQFSEQGLDVVNVAIPNEHRLLPNYPNPFNPSTTIGYQLSAISKIELTIFDLNGKKIDTLIDKTQSSGVYELTWDAGLLAAGAYICVLKVDDEIVDSHKMILIK